MNAAIYARKSTAQDDVAEDAKSVSRQIAGARAFITAKGWTLHEHHVFTDDGVSGALFANRAEFQKMMRAAEAGTIETVVLYDLDRFGRHAHQTMLALHTLADLGIAVWDFSTGHAVDLDSFEGRLTTGLKAEFAQQFRDQIRKHTTAAMRQKAEAGFVTGGKVFGYDNHRIAKGQVVRRRNEQEAAIVQEIYTRYADGDGARGIAAHLNRRGVPAPRAQQGRPSGWSAATVKSVLERSLYRGEVIYGRTKKAYGRELGKRSGREKGMLLQPESAWLRRDAPTLRLIDPDLADRCDARRQDRRTRYLASVAKGGRVPERAHGRYLLSGGMLICPTCGGHFEARITPWHGVREAYICSTRRRKPGVCSNTLALPIAETDDDVLSIVEGEVLGTAVITELLTLVDDGAAQETTHLQADRDRLQREIDNLLELTASGIAVETIAPKVLDRQKALAKVDHQLRTPRPEPLDLERLRAALEQRAASWKADLRAEPRVARLVLRRLVGPLTLWEEPARWEADSRPAGLLEGLDHLGTSPRGLPKVVALSAPLRRTA
jgi:site-specific DNA recombinase